MYEIKTKDVYEDFSNDKNNDKEHKKAKGEMNVFIYMNRCIHYTIKKTKKNQMFGRHQNMQRVPGIKKIKSINYLNKNMPKKYIGLNIDKRK